MPVPPAFAASALYDSLLQGALQRFLARATLELEASLTDSDIRSLSIEPTDDPCELVLRWFGTRHILHVPRSQPFTAHELRVARAIGEVLAARYSTIFDSAVMAARADLFQGLIEDRYVAAFLDRRPYRAGVERNRADRLAHCIEVLRVAALSSYESRAISSGVLVLGDDAAHGRQGAARLYGQPLTAVKSFYRLCDGLRTVFLVGEDGLLLDIIDITHRAREIHPMMAITSPCPSAYRQHAAATLGTRDTCIVLSPSHEIKVFAEGAHVFTFRNAEWHLLDVEAKYVQWLQAVGSRPIAEKLFQCALDMADARQGALLVVLRDVEAANALVAPIDRLDRPATAGPTGDGSRRPLHYLLRGRTLDDVEDSVLMALASLDGATVVDTHGRLIAAGAILMHPQGEVGDAWVSEGARTTAAQAAGRFGPVLKVSTDGMMTCYDGLRLWEI
ncbi:hypothetical protein TBR22_A45460 [Luteitalea sp. TBR-22]|uniref:hypothetical protein n=1 Tax=Luteitalea sp. TBR-22 TaxID=2802971 RepID=UPI001AF67E89|nr:hypothetical protein [Luteitalea sp. TBR-22]BCS35319.1 hypothetical protein TBR22_A45460 [Luteitalea sp. TBR-22]